MGGTHPENDCTFERGTNAILKVVSFFFHFISVLEIKRLQEASAFRKEEKKNGWNTSLYRELKKARTEFNSTYKEIVDLEATIRQSSTQFSDSEEVVSILRLKDALESNRLSINGIDPGIPT
ncbi:hypothetical protein INT47_007741 [Mucor saturninus]|uniref:Uncharacterized protein n=1 Tax=Mucor saturninus TaxID=64648 RepID=A0A8H7QWN1_9FUNG|nr:hypothetical protein INT47_007741 [Mucor saturninus]